MLANLPNLYDLELINLYIELCRDCLGDDSTWDLTRLVIYNCATDRDDAEAHFSAMPHLRHLAVNMFYKGRGPPVSFPGEVLLGMPFLDYLELDGGVMFRSNALQYVQCLKGLQELRLCSTGCTGEDLAVTTSDLVGLSDLTSLHLTQQGCLQRSPVDAGFLASLNQLHVLVIPVPASPTLHWKHHCVQESSSPRWSTVVAIVR